VHIHQFEAIFRNWTTSDPNLSFVRRCIIATNQKAVLVDIFTIAHEIFKTRSPKKMLLQDNSNRCLNAFSSKVLFESRKV